MNCRGCGAGLTRSFVDLGTAPPSNAFLDTAALARPEAWYPLALLVCDKCRLVQTLDVASSEQIFSSDYVYFSSYSRSWLAHAERFVAQAVERLRLGPDSLVVELAANDGYLLQYVAARGIPCIGVEPTASTARAARERGIAVVEQFFGRALGEEMGSARTADLVVANNVFAHVPDPVDFAAGIAALLAPGGLASIEFPHVLELVRGGQFDTIYQEHFSYFSLHSAEALLRRAGLRVCDVEQLATHGGSLRLWACRADSVHAEAPAVAALRAVERDAGMLEDRFYAGFQAVAEKVKDEFLSFLLASKREGATVAGYGAAAKGNTLLNFAGVRADLLRCVADASPHKQGRWLPGSRIPVVAEAHLRALRPDYVVVLPWNLFAEISVQLGYIRDWGGCFVTAVPRLEVR